MDSHIEQQMIDHISPTPHPHSHIPSHSHININAHQHTYMHPHHQSYEQLDQMEQSDIQHMALTTNINSIGMTTLPPHGVHHMHYAYHPYQLSPHGYHGHHTLAMGHGYSQHTHPNSHHQQPSSHAQHQSHPPPHLHPPHSNPHSHPSLPHTQHHSTSPLSQTHHVNPMQYPHAPMHHSSSHPIMTMQLPPPLPHLVPPKQFYSEVISPSSSSESLDSNSSEHLNREFGEKKVKHYRNRSSTESPMFDYTDKPYQGVVPGTEPKVPTHILEVTGLPEGLSQYQIMETLEVIFKLNLKKKKKKHEQTQTKKNKTKQNKQKHTTHTHKKKKKANKNK